MASTANIKAVITAEDRASATIKGFGDRTAGIGRKIASTMKVAAAAVTAAVGVTIIKNIDNAIRRLDTLANSARTFENMGFSAKEVDKAMKALDKSIRGLPTPLDSAVRGMTTITASLNDIGKSQKVFTALNNAVLGFGGTTEMVDNAVLQLSQDMGTGRVTARTWLSLMNSGLTPALAAMSRQMGITTQELRDGLSSGTVSIDEFLDTLIKMDRDGGGGLKSFEQIAKDSTAGIQSAWTNMNTAIARGIANLMDKIGRNNLSGAIIRLGEIFEQVFTGIANTGDELAPFIEKAKELAVLVGNFLSPKLEALANTIREDLGPTMQRLWKEVIEPMLPTIGVALVVALGLAIDAVNLWIKSWTNLVNFGVSIKKFFDSILEKMFYFVDRVYAKGREIYDAIAGPFLRAFKAIRDGFREVENAAKKVPGLGGGLNVKGGIGNILRGMIPGFATGTSFAPGGTALVGERGPELVNLPRGSRVQPTDRTQGIGGNTQISLNVNVGVFTGSEIEKRKLAKSMLKSLQEIASSQGMSMDQLLGAS